MQAIAIMLALILVTGSAYSMFMLGGEAKAQQQQPKHEIGQPDYLKQFNTGITNNLTNGTTVRNFTLLTEETHQVPISTREQLDGPDSFSWLDV